MQCESEKTGRRDGNMHSWLLKDNKVKGLRAAYSIRYRNVDKYSAKLAGGMNQVRAQAKEGFPLDRVNCEACTWSYGRLEQYGREGEETWCHRPFV